MTEDQQGGTEQPTEASAADTAAEQTVGAIAVADEPAASQSLDIEAEAPATTDQRDADQAQALAPETGKTESIADADSAVSPSQSNNGVDAGNGDAGERTTDVAARAPADQGAADAPAAAGDAATAAPAVSNGRTTTNLRSMTVSFGRDAALAKPLCPCRSSVP